MSRMKRIARELVLWTGGALGALCLLSFLAGWLFQVTPLVFVSGSMSPSYDAGALGISHQVPAGDLRVGDVVSVHTADGGRVTHRIVTVEEHGRFAALTLKGDTNDLVDTETYTVSAADRVAFGVPYAGYALSAASTPVGLLAGGLLVVGAVALGFRPEGPRRRAHAASGSASPRRRHALVAVGAVSALTVGGALGVGGISPFSPTGALWTDSATANATITATTPDTTAPVLSNPIPANNAIAPTWSALDCADSGGGLDQICVTATDTGGSGVSTVAVKLVRTSGTTQCWNGSIFVNGTGCSAQSMAVLSGSQYRTSLLTSAVMVLGTYQATFTATDVAGNSANLVVTFSVGPVITACSRNTSSGDITVTWGLVSGATSYNITTTATGTTINVTSPRVVAVGKNTNGTVTVTGVNATTGSVTSVAWTYDGNGSNQACHS